MTVEPSDLSWQKAGEFPFLYSEGWQRAGIRHGFTGVTKQYEDLNLEDWSSHFCNAFAIQAVCMLKQKHSQSIMDLTEDAISSAYRTGGRLRCLHEADAFLLPHAVVPGVAFIIRTADCVPILLRSQRHFALIHAGWRGLANGIVSAVVKRMLSLDDTVEALIGPAARAERYEVGQEVVDAVGEMAAVEKRAGRWFLDTSLTAFRQLIAAGNDRVIVTMSQLCTIQDSRFYSFRRNGAKSRNIAFIVPP